MTKRSVERIVLACAIGLALATIGCATTGAGETDAVPAHPFPRWVAHLEPGVTDIAEIESIFGAPAETRESVRGGLRWRYAYAEVHWDADDPDRPPVAADGTPIEREPTWVDHTREAFDRTGRFLDRLLFYPGRQPRGPRTRAMDATIHDLELRFTTEGVLADYLYAPRRQRLRVPVGGA
ncbi:MAG: hypothetical protein AAGC67_09230 [Myxococcota bacterium]